MKRKSAKTFLFLLTFLTAVAVQGQNDILEHIDVQPVWSGHPVGFALLTHEDRQFVAFFRQYDNNGTIEHRLSFAQRYLNSSTWTFHHTTQTTPWDSHNYMTMAVDDDNYIHVSGNMHVDPLRYYRSTQPLDITSIDVSQSTPMVGELESAVTYPLFLRDPANRLIFNYRDGASGAGDTIYNVYDHKTQTWSRLLDTPLLDGEGLRNAYPWGPILGPDGYMHLIWVWRDSSDASTNHTVSYMKSPDLENWYAADGSKLTLPITYGNAAVVVDPVPVQQGLLNGGQKIGFDSEDRPVLSYYRYENYTDLTAATQIFNARFESGAWQVRQTSNWNYRWEFSGGGTIAGDIYVNEVKLDDSGHLTQRVGNAVEGSALWTLSETDFSILSSQTPPALHPTELSEKHHIFPGVTSGEGYVYTPSTATGEGVVSIPFSVNTAGDYDVWARIRGMEGNLPLTDSFFVQIDNGSEIEWHNQAQSAWQWRKVTSGPTRLPIRFSLSAGNHTLHFKTREPGSEVDMAVVTADPEFQPVAPSPKANGKEYVGSCFENPDSGSVTWLVDVPTTGDYVLWARTRAKKGYIANSDSYFVRVDSLSETYWSIPPYAVWTWGQITDGGTPRNYTLSAGTHHIRLRTREAGAAVDSLALAFASEPQSPVITWEAEDNPILLSPVTVYSESPESDNQMYLDVAQGTITAPMRHMLEQPSDNEMTVRISLDLNGSEYPDKRYIMRWETLGSNRDYARPQPWPEPTMLELYYLGKRVPSSVAFPEMDLYR